MVLMARCWLASMDRDGHVKVKTELEVGLMEGAAALFARSVGVVVAEFEMMGFDGTNDVEKDIFGHEMKLKRTRDTRERKFQRCENLPWVSSSLLETPSVSLSNGCEGGDGCDDGDDGRRRLMSS